MKRTILGVVVALGLFAGGVFAQDRIFPFKGAHQDISIDPPCMAVSTSMTVYDRNPWLVFTCNTGQVILRRYMNPNDNVIAPVPVLIVPDVAPVVPKNQVLVPCTFPGMVTSVHGGCVPPDHKDAQPAKP